MSDANTLKDQGNKAFQAKDYDRAIALFSEAIKLDPTNHVLYSNRSAANAGKRSWEEALEDAEACVKVNPTWSKGYARKGAALHGMHRWDEAVEAYEEGLKLEESPALRKGLREVEDARSADFGNKGDDPTGLSKMFSAPDMLPKLAANPKTAKHLTDPSFMQKLMAIQRNPALAASSLSDPRMIEAMGVLMGIDLSTFSRQEDADAFSSGKSKSSTTSPFNTSGPSTSTPTRPTPSASVSEDVEMTNEEEEDPEVLEEKKAAADAEAQKKIGSEAYKKRDLEAAATAFEKAWDLWPKDMTFLTNLGAVYFEQGQYDKCIETCEKAVDEGRSLRADFKLVAKAFGRIGSAYAKKDDHANAVKFFQKSLSEHRTPDILNKLRDAEKQQREQEKQAYINPELSEKAREEGNALFKSGDFVGAVKSYTESIKRDPSDPRGYNNRALCYTKLAALPEALKDADEAIKIDPKFVKGYIRKSTVLFSMREYEKALEAITEAAEHDGNQQHTKEIQQQLIKCNEALSTQRDGESEEQTLQRAMRDPEVAQIMNDPVMQQILQQAQQNPGALQDHMKNPVVRQKIQRLVNAGIIRTR